MYLRAAKTEAEEAGEETTGMANSVSELRGELLALTGNKVDIQVEGKDEFKSTYQILKELSEVWGDLTDISQANILEMVGGKRNANVVAAIIENFGVAESVLATSMKSEGSALTEHAKAMDSIAGKASVLKSSFAGLSESLIDAEDVKSLLSGAIALVDVLGKMSSFMNNFGGLKTELIAIAGIFATINADKGVNIISDAFKLLKKNMSEVPLGLFVKGFKEAGEAGFTATERIKYGFTSMTASASTAKIAVGSVAAAITLLVTAYSLYSQAREKAIQDHTESAAEATKVAESAKALASSYAEYSRYASMTDRTRSQETRMDSALKKVTDSIVGKTKALENLTEGTYEYNKALKELVDAELRASSSDVNRAEYESGKALLKSSKNLFGSKLDITYATGTTLNKKEADLVESLMGDFVYANSRGGQAAVVEYKIGVNADNVEEITSFLYGLEELRDYMAENEMMEGSFFYDKISKTLSDYENLLQSYEDAAYNKFSSEYMSENKIPVTVDEQKAYYRDMIIGMRNALGMSEEMAIGFVDAKFATEGYTSAIGSFNEQISELGSDSSNKAITKATALKDALHSLINSEDFDDTRNSLKEIVDNVGDISPDNIETLADESEELAEVLKKDGMSAKFLASVLSRELRGENGIEQITDGALALNEALEGLRGRFDEVTEAKRRYDDAMSIDEKDSNFKSIAEAFKTLNDEFVAGTTNSNSFWASAEYIFGEAQLESWGWEEGLQEIYDAMKANANIFKDEESAGFGFIDRFLNVAKGGKIVDEYGKTVAEIKKLSDGMFDIDIDGSAISLIAKEMKLSEEAVLSCVEALDMWGDIDFHNIDEVIAKAGELNLVMYKNNGKNRVINFDGLKEQLKTLGFTSKEINDIREELAQLNNVSLVGADMQVEELASSLEKLGIITSTEFGVEVNLEELAVLFEGLGFTEEQAKKTIEKLSGMNNIMFRNLKGELSSVDDAMSKIESLDLSGVRSELSDATDVAKQFDTILTTINGKQIRVDVSAEGLQNAANLGAGINAYASGTKNAQRGIALVGEHSEEIVQSGSTARIVGSNGPELTYLNKGDIVYNAEETKKIKGSIGRVRGVFPSFANGGVYGGIGKNKWSSVLEGADGSSDGGKNGSSDTKSESEFEKMYKYHKHLVAMDKELLKDFIEWLDKAYKDAYNKGEIDLDDYRKYCEEVYDGMKDLFRDYLNDTEHEISMRESHEGESKKIISLYEEMIDAIEKEIESAREYGLDNNSDYIQELQSQYVSYVDSIKELQDEITEDAKDSLEKLIDIKMDMNKKDIEEDKKAIDTKLDNLKEFYDKQKEMLKKSHDEEQYLESQAEKRKAVSDIRNQLSQLDYDDSAWAQKRKHELEQELFKAEKELVKFEKEHALDLTQARLDEMYESQKKELDRQNEIIEKKEEDAKAVYEQALDDIRNGSVTLYEEMISWNQKYGDGIDDTIKTAWEEAYVALEKYHDLFDKHYNGVILENATGYIPVNGSWKNSPVSGYANGTNNATAGIHAINERGEEYLFTSSNDGATYRVFTGGEKVLNARATQFLYDFANGGKEILSKIIDASVGKGIVNKLFGKSGVNQIEMGDIIIQGNADKKTVSEIRRAQRENLSDMLKSLNSLNK